MNPFDFYLGAVLRHQLDEREDKLMINATKMAEDYKPTAIQEFLCSKEQDTLAYIYVIMEQDRCDTHDICFAADNGDIMMNETLAFTFAKVLEPGGFLKESYSVAEYEEILAKFERSSNIEL